jgi:16S rRNA (adenine1518-N6/adenine1519-N6)-dimethyltransferase
VHRSLHAVLKRHGIRPDKRLGQHFLAATPTMRKIVDAIAPSDDECVLEIGPGPGLMTALIAERAGFVIAVDKDRKMLDVARREHEDVENVRWHEGDILEFDLGSGLRDIPSRLRGRPVKVAGNLPYNISSPILFWILKNRDLISRAIVMVQREVALRIAARPGGKDYGTLSVRTQAYASARRLFDVSPGNFVPPPEVDSSVVELDFAGGASKKPGDDALFEAVVRAAFGKRRKTIRNALAGLAPGGLSAEALLDALDRAGIDAVRRPETVSVEEFVRLSSILKSARND